LLDARSGFFDRASDRFLDEIIRGSVIVRQIARVAPETRQQSLDLPSKIVDLWRFLAEGGGLFLFHAFPYASLHLWAGPVSRPFDFSQTLFQQSGSVLQLVSRLESSFPNPRLSGPLGKFVVLRRQLAQPVCLIHGPSSLATLLAGRSISAL
jgi:hypothetical protein